MPYFIAIDIGTTHCKAVVTTSAAEVLNEVKAGYPSQQPKAGYHEQDPDQLFNAVIDVLTRAIQSVPEKQQILAVSFSAAMHSLMAVDSEGHPLTTLWTWADTRSSEIAASLKATASGQQIHDHTGTPVHPMSPLCKIAWIRREMPEIFEATHKFISGKEYIFFRLTGKYTVDTGIASATGLLDVKTLRWYKPALDFAGIDAAKLSTLAEPTDLLPSILPEYKKLFGLNTAIAFIHGGSDGGLANTGAGAILPGEAALTIGTSGAIRILSDQPVQDQQNRLFNYRLDKDFYLPGGAINNGGLLLKWFIQIFTDNTRSFDAYLEELMPKAGAIEPGAGGLIFLPYIYGERAPVWDAEASGMFIGMTASHTRAHYLRAVLEGVGYSLKQILLAIEENGIAVDTLFAGGGFIESPVWLRIITDILQKPVRVSYAADASAMGAIFMAMKATGIIKEWKEVKGFMKEDELYKPVRGVEDVYEKNFAVYKELYKRFKEIR
ncbi:MAG: gluconate kinase [Citrobacter freundii]|nr:MAG: gluconate kinase [Citrobacter freundii]